MKKIAITLLLVLLVIPFQITYSQKDSVHVGFALANLYSERWGHDRDYYKERLNELGGKVTFIDCYDIANNQIDAVQKFVDMNVDCIVIVAVDARLAKTAVDIANAANIPVIAYDRLILGCNLDLYTTVNSITVGEMMAKEVVKNLPTGKILFVGGPSDDFNSTLIRRGVFTVLDKKKDKYQIKSVQTATWNELDAYMNIQEYITNESTIPDAIICSADALTYGAIDVLKEYNNYGKVLLTGQDAELEICRQVIQGNVLMTVYKSNKALAYASAEATMKLIKGEKINVTEKIDNRQKEVPAVMIDPILITKDNAVDILTKEGIYTKEELLSE